MNLDRLRRETSLSHVEHHASLTSTNDRARELAAGLTTGATALVVADEQTAGRGRGANRWWTGPGSLAFSFVFDPQTHGIRRETSPLVSLAAALAVIETVQSLVPPSPLGLHWPNDVFAAGRKLSGILVEAQPDGRHVVGIGLNVNNRTSAAPVELQSRVTSLADLSGSAHDRTDVLVALVVQLQKHLTDLAADSAELARRADRACLQHGQPLTIEIGQRRTTGWCAGIADDGALILRTSSGTERFYSGALVHE